MTRRVRGVGVVALLRAGAAVARHPELWVVALRQAGRLRAPGRIGPAPEYLAFRMVTQYGRADHRPVADDVIGYLRWCRQWRRLEP